MQVILVMCLYSVKTNNSKDVKEYCAITDTIKSSEHCNE